MRLIVSCLRFCSRTRLCPSRKWRNASVCRDALLETHPKARSERCDHPAVAIVDPDSVGVGLSVFVGVEAGEHTPEWLQRFSAGVAAMPAVMEVYRMAGEVDYMLRVAVADMAEYDRFYKRLIAIAR